MRIFLTMVVAVALTTAFAVRVPATAAPQQQDGAAIYKRCAACHLATGAGVPGAFPPLAADVRNLSQTAAGRRNRQIELFSRPAHTAQMANGHKKTQ